MNNDTTNTGADYDELEARLTDPGVPAVSGGQVATGDAAAAVGRDFLLREYGSQEAIERAMVTRGRPRVGRAAGPSPTVRARVTDADSAALKALQRLTGRSESDLVREAVHELLARHQLVS